MKILITGAKGQLGQDLVKLLSMNHDVIGLDRDGMDITVLEQVLEKVMSIDPDVIIHAAAYTAVDQAEADVDAAYTVNVVGSRNIAVAAEQVQAKVCYISTDYVFDGTASSPYSEYDNTNPQGVYGKSKRGGEVLIQSLCSRYFIVRTSWVYGAYGNNFVKTMLRLGREKDQLKVVHDQIGSPTYTVDLSKFLSDLIATNKYGIYHASNTGVCSWYDFAKAIFEESKIDIDLQPCTTKDFPRPAPRPQYSVMDHIAIRSNGFKELRDWRQALQSFLTEREGQGHADS